TLLLSGRPSMATRLGEAVTVAYGGSRHLRRGATTVSGGGARACRLGAGDQLTRRKGVQLCALRFPAWSEATTQKRRRGLWRRAGTAQRTWTVRVPTAKTCGELRVASSDRSSYTRTSALLRPLSSKTSNRRVAGRPRRAVAGWAVTSGA